MRSPGTYFFDLVGNFPEGVVVHRHGILLFANSAAARILGYADPDAIVALRDIERVIDPRDLSRLLEWPDKNVGRSGGDRVDIGAWRKDGASVRLQGRAHSIEWEGGRSHLLAFVDAERRAIPELPPPFESDLIHLSRLTDLGRVAAGLIHEISQPLTVVSNLVAVCVRLLERDPAETDAALLAALRVDGQMTRVSEIIQRTRDFIRKAPPNHMAADIGAIVRDAVSLMADETGRRGVRVHVRIAEGLPAVRADPVQIQQVVLNLAMNGVEAMDEAGCDDRTLFVRVADVGGAVRVSVEDRGPGIPDEVLRRQFEPFFTTKRSGLGVGLAVSRHILAAHSSHLTMERGRRVGTIASFDLPLNPRPVDPLAGGEPEAAEFARHPSTKHA